MLEGPDNCSSLKHETESLVNEVSLFCAECGYPANSQKELEQHWKTAANHLPLRSNRCPYPSCGFPLCSKKRLNQHIKQVHLAEKSHKCSKCTRLFLRRMGYSGIKSESILRAFLLRRKTQVAIGNIHVKYAPLVLTIINCEHKHRLAHYM